jgi:hypothetical protein
MNGVQKFLMLLLDGKVVTLYLSEGLSSALSDRLMEGFSFFSDVEHARWKKDKNYTDRKV